MKFITYGHNCIVHIKFSENEDAIFIQHFDNIKFYIDERNNVFSDSE